ncbi:glycosyltransferase [Aerococcaceae bacterium DSM 109653]|uniref:Glycosyltransferase n=1 Tax=Fundicoccus ignavus TaxID=2664442 RepID=A0A844BWE1_9LACT|nr:glycosyltransferase [Fundicoccus ignavus]MRI80796.1 glycosyltransferase [Fundicoccus ignavus]
MKVLFQRSEQAFLPEIDAYIEYLNQDQRFQAFDSSKLEAGYDIEVYDVIWEFKGFGGIQSNQQLIVHEYASLSTGKFPRTKNFIKSRYNPTPDLRIFLNEAVHRGFNFKDQVEYTYRDMGIDSQFLQQTTTQKEFDYVYVGSISKEREIDQLLQSFTQKANGKLCLVGSVEDDIYESYKNHPDLTFTGKVAYHEVPEIATKAVYGLNYMPDKYPFNFQTSTKLLEYLALGLKIITTNYQWVNDFQKKHDSQFFTLGKDKVFDVTGIDEFEFKNHFKAEEYTWEKVLEAAQIKEKLLHQWQ